MAGQRRAQDAAGRQTRALASPFSPGLPYSRPLRPGSLDNLSATEAQKQTWNYLTQTACGDIQPRVSMTPSPWLPVLR